MRPTNINTVAHQWLSDYITEDWVVVDATVGTGSDTLFLAKATKKVYAFDIQEEAIHYAQEKTKGYTNIEYICDSHAKLANYVREPIDLIVFNLGYFPKGNAKIITQPQSTLEAIQQAIPLLKENGIILITFYIGHAGGLDEYQYIDLHLNNLPLTQLKSYTYKDRENAPILYLLQK